MTEFATLVWKAGLRTYFRIERICGELDERNELRLLFTILHPVRCQIPFVEGSQLRVALKVQVRFECPHVT